MDDGKLGPASAVTDCFLANDGGIGFVGRDCELLGPLTISLRTEELEAGVTISTPPMPPLMGSFSRVRKPLSTPTRGPRSTLVAGDDGEEGRSGSLPSTKAAMRLRTHCSDLDPQAQVVNVLLSACNIEFIWLRRWCTWFGL